MHHGRLPGPTLASASGGWIVSFRLENWAAMSATFCDGCPPQGAVSDAIASRRPPRELYSARCDRRGEQAAQRPPLATRATHATPR